MAARPKNGRPLQNPTAFGEDGFVAAVPSREFRDGTGMFTVKLSHYPEGFSLRLLIFPGSELPDGAARANFLSMYNQCGSLEIKSAVPEISVR